MDEDAPPPPTNDDGDFRNSSPFFFAIVTTLREPEVETAGDREGAAMVMRVPHTEDLRRADIGASGREFARERGKKKKVKKTVYPISCVTGDGIKELLEAVHKKL